MHWRFDPVGGYGVAALVAAALLLLPVLVGPAARGLSSRQRRTLLGLRGVATLLLVFAWLRPALVAVREEPLPATLLVLVDASRSMTVEDALDGASRWDAARRVLDAAKGSLARVAERQGLRAFAFADDLAPIPLDPTGAVALPDEPTGGETALGHALDGLLSAASGERLLGVVLLSDGAQRASPPRDLAPLVAARRLQAESAPLWAFPLGDRLTSAGEDVAVEDLAVGETAFAGAPLDVRARLRVAGYANRRIDIRLLWENAEGEQEVVDATTAVARPGVGVYPLDLRHTPTAPGEWKLTVRAEPQEGETLTGNNEQSTFVTVREGGVRVLYLAGATRVGGSPGVEQQFVRRSLAASPDLVVERLAFNYEPPEPDLAERLRAGPTPDVVFLDNVDSRAASGRAWIQLAAVVERGVGLAMLGGAHSFGPGGHRGTALADVLPVEIGRAERQSFDAPFRDDVHLPGPLRIAPTAPLGARHPILQLGGDEPLAAWPELTLAGANRLARSRVKPNAVVLAQAAGGEAPLLVAGQYGLGRVLAFAGDTTWRWVLAGRGEEHRRFWRQATLWLAKKDDDSGAAVYVELASRRVAPGATLDVAAGVRTPADAEPTPGASPPIRYEATVATPEGETRELLLPGDRPRTSGPFRATRAPGDYTVTVRAVSGDETLGEARARFLVPSVDLELDRPAAEPDALAQLAAATADAGGALLAPEELPALLERLADDEPETRQEVTEVATPWDTWPFFLLLVGLMASEWWLRRRWGMP